MITRRIAVIGAGIAGLSAAVDLAVGGCEVHLFERAATPGGKLRQLRPGGAVMDAGPSVFTLRSVFDALFADAGDDLDRRLTLTPASVLARHAWRGGGTLDLFADFERSVDAVAGFSGPREAQAFRAFAEHARRVYRTLDKSFMQASRPSPVGLMRRVGVSRLHDLWNIQPFATLWKSLGGVFTDPRLRQLFARYATYCGSSPFSSPATLMLIAHVEQAGVWYVDGGMHELAVQLTQLALRQGARLSFNAGVAQILVERGRVRGIELENGERLAVDGVVCNADNNALATGLLGDAVAGAVRATAREARSASAITWNLEAHTTGFELAHHSVFFSTDYRAEFDAIFKRRVVPDEPTIYVCAEDRRDGALRTTNGSERLFCLINAPPIGDTHAFTAPEIDSCATRVFQQLAGFGLQVNRRAEATIATSPTDFHRLFPATGGALYGPASHGWMASFARPGSAARIPGLYLAGGSTHPGPGVPMAATSGRLAAARLMRDFASTRRFPRAATSGGTSMQ